jgi:nicotinamide riboside transporter PnuC
VGVVNKILLIAEVLMVAGAILGSMLLSLNIDASKWGYVLFLISSVSSIYVGQKKNVLSLTLMSISFTIINMVGVYRWFV